MRKILVTGGAGYIGAVLTEALLTHGFDVTVVDNFMWGVPSLAHLCRYWGLNIVRGDARDMRVMRPLLKQHDVLIPLAALVGAPLCDRDNHGAISTNRDAIFNAVDNMSDDQRILYPNTNSGYGVGGEELCTEESPLRPVSLYGTTKCAAEDTLLNRGNAVVFRLATVFGMSPRMRLDLLVNDFVWRAVNDKSVTLFEPHFRRNYIHVRDVANVFLYALTVNLFDGAYNVGLSSANLSKWQLCEQIAKQVPGFVFNEAAIGEDPDKRDYIVSNEKIETAGWRPQLSLAEGIAELVKGYHMLKRCPYGNV